MYPILLEASGSGLSDLFGRGRIRPGNPDRPASQPALAFLLLEVLNQKIIHPTWILICSTLRCAGDFRRLPGRRQYHY